MWQELLGGDSGGMIVLDKVFRQKDSTFLNMLNELRRGFVSPQTIKVLSGKVREYEQYRQQQSSGGNVIEKDEDLKTIKPTKLYSTNKDVDFYNLSELRELSSEESETFKAVDEGTEQFLNQLRAGMKAPTVLELKVGSQVN